MSRSQFFEQPSFIPIFKDYSHFLGKSIGVTGQSGVLGGVLCNRLDNHKIHVEAYHGDITNIRSLEVWFKKYQFDYFFHFAAIVPVNQVMHHPLRAYDVNVIGSYNICKQIIETQKDCWLFLASSSHIYKANPILSKQALKEGSAKEPDTFYGVSKLAAERICIPILDQYEVDDCIGRIFSFSGATQKEPYLVPTLRRKINETPEKGVLEIVNPNSVRDIMDAETVVDCVFHLAQKHFKGILNIGSGKGMSVKNITCHIMKLLGKTPKIRGVNKTKPNALVADVHVLKQVLSKSEHV